MKKILLATNIFTLIIAIIIGLSLRNDLDAAKAENINILDEVKLVEQEAQRNAVMARAAEAAALAEKRAADLARDAAIAAQTVADEQRAEAIAGLANCK